MVVFGSKWWSQVTFVPWLQGFLEFLFLRDDRPPFLSLTCVFYSNYHVPLTQNYIISHMVVLKTVLIFSVIYSSIFQLILCVCEPGKFKPFTYSHGIRFPWEQEQGCVWLTAAEIGHFTNYELTLWNYLWGCLWHLHLYFC